MHCALHLNLFDHFRPIYKKRRLKRRPERSEPWGLGISPRQEGSNEGPGEANLGSRAFFQESRLKRTPSEASPGFPSGKKAQNEGSSEESQGVWGFPQEGGSCSRSDDEVIRRHTISVGKTATFNCKYRPLGGTI
jgi:hypothetical protein